MIRIKKVSKEMAPQESKFIRQLKITLISVLGPFILLAAGSLVKDHYAIKNIKHHVEVLEETYVSQDILLLYLNELRQYNTILRERIQGNEKDFADKLTHIDNRLDQIMREVYLFKVRGGRTLGEISEEQKNKP
jgi:hypothetical protein